MLLNKPKKSIFIIGPIPPPYHGVSIAIKKLLHSEINKDFEIHHLDLSDQRGIEYVGKPDLFDVIIFLRQFLKAIKIVFYKRPSIAYLPISQKTLGILRDSFLILLCLVGGCKVVLHLHGGNFRNWYEKRIRIFQLYIRYILKNINKMIVLSELFKDIFDGLIPQNKIEIVSNGVGLPPEKEYGINTYQKIKNSSVNVLYLGTLKKEKGVLNLLKSIPLVIRERQYIHFVFAGPWSDENDKNEAFGFIEKNKISNSVNFAGIVDDKRKWDVLHSSDIFVFPGIQQEGQPLVVLEAMAVGLPIIFTNQGCLSETILEGKNGFQIRENDPVDIANKIILLAENSQMRREMGQKSKERYSNAFTDKHYKMNMMKVFKGLPE